MNYSEGVLAKTFSLTHSLSPVNLYILNENLKIEEDIIQGELNKW